MPPPLFSYETSENACTEQTSRIHSHSNVRLANVTAAAVTYRASAGIQRRGKPMRTTLLRSSGVTESSAILPTSRSIGIEFQPVINGVASSPAGCDYFCRKGRARRGYSSERCHQSSASLSDVVVCGATMTAQGGAHSASERRRVAMTCTH